ncbi:MAG: ABC transporter substrate-binding protein [Candidatus Limnocylindrales bacterium]|nr:ABC transporter substrate-binding protein [Candidatus Limnocylindrales bacterium]
MTNRTLRRLVVGLAAVSVALAACSSSPGASTAPGASEGTGSSPAAGGGTVNMAINPWVGYEADAAVVAYLLENELGYTVEKKDLKEDVSWQGFETGEVDLILENWGHPDLEKKYIDEDKVAVNAGPTGNIGIIGWYVPGWMVEEYPDITDYNNLNKYADLFKTSESGDLGQFLGADPSYVQYDEALVKNLGLNFKVIFSGGEAASITAFQQAEKDRKPLIGYFYDPQWLHSQIKLVRVNLPAYAAGCDADLEKVACDYPEYELNKIVSSTFADSGGAAVELVRNFSWTNEDQNLVSDYITNQNMSAEEAGKKWVEENEAKWKAWMPAS